MEFLAALIGAAFENPEENGGVARGLWHAFLAIVLFVGLLSLLGWASMAGS